MQGYMALIIEEENLNFHLLNNSIGLEPSRIVKKGQKIAIVEINFYINSEKGQFGYTLCTEQLSKISSFGININFHILSFGSV